MREDVCIGHVMVPKDGADDIGRRLGEENWEAFFDCVPVPEEAWRELDRMLILDAIQRLADGIVGRSEEAWVKRPDLLAAACRDAFDRVSPETRAFLVEVAGLAKAANARGSVVILAIS